MRYIHPKAYLISKRNVRKGLISRTRIIQSLESGNKYLSKINKESNLSDACIRYHLKTLRKEGIVKKTTNNKPYLWALTGRGQQQLI